MTPTQERPLAAGDLWSTRDGRRRSRPNALPRCPTCPTAHRVAWYNGRSLKRK